MGLPAELLLFRRPFGARRGQRVEGVEAGVDELFVLAAFGQRPVVLPLLHREQETGRPGFGVQRYARGLEGGSFVGRHVLHDGLPVQDQGGVGLGVPQIVHRRGECAFDLPAAPREAGFELRALGVGFERGQAGVAEQRGQGFFLARLARRHDQRRGKPVQAFHRQREIGAFAYDLEQIVVVGEFVVGQGAAGAGGHEE